MVSEMQIYYKKVQFVLKNIPKNGKSICNNKVL